MLYPKTSSFANASIILPVINETNSLVQTVSVLLSLAKEDICEILIVTAPKTTDQSLTTIKSLQERHGSIIVAFQQTLPGLGGALREAFHRSRGSHVLMMASDLETDPVLAPQLIALARQNPDAVGTVTRWQRGGGFHGYNPVKLLLNAIFQKIFSLLYQTNLSDMTYAYRIFPKKLLQAILWEEFRHPFLFETLIKPLRLGVSVIEIPGKWQARDEGESQNTFFRNFAYFKIGFRVRFSSPKTFLQE